MAKILFIEDDFTILRPYKFALQHAGHEVLTASNGTIGLDMALKEKPDLILLDMVMLGLSGREVLKQLNVRHNLPNTKVIVLSNVESPKVIEEAKKLGASDSWIKVNVPPIELIEKIKPFLPGGSTGHALGNTP